MMFACAHCGKEFKYESEKKRHEISHTPQFECPECLKKFSFISALRRHQKQHNRTGSVQCTECSRNFRDETLLKRHVKYAHKETHLCSKCDAKFNSHQALLSHQKTHKPKSERRYQCSYNGCEKTFNFTHHLKHHELTHSTDKQHFCSSCGKGFIQLHHLKTHLKRHKPSSWLNCCEIGCLKTFTNEYALKRHQATHKPIIKSGSEYDLSYESDITTSPDYLKDDSSQDFGHFYTEDLKQASDLYEKYKLLEDLSMKKTLQERILNVENINYYDNNIYRDTLNTPLTEPKNVVPSKLNKETTCPGCECGKAKSMKKDMPELKYNSDGTIKIKEFIDVDLTVIKEAKNLDDRKDLGNKLVPYNSCKAVLGSCIVSGTGTISDECLCAKMAIDDSSMIYEEIDELTPLPCRV